MWRRLQSTAMASTRASPSNSLDLEFVFGLLERRNKSLNAEDKGSEIDIGQWSKVKFNTIQVERPATSSQLEKTPEFIPPPIINTNTERSQESILTRLQNLANSLPNKITTPTATSPFFDPESLAKRAAPVFIKSETETEKTIIKLPTLDYDSRDWSKVSISSILSKIIPEEALNATEAAPSCQETQTVQMSTTFSPAELRLLDRDQLFALAESKNIKTNNLTEIKIEAELLLQFGDPSSPLPLRRAVVSKSASSFTWTEEMESLLLRIYDETRAKKQAIDTKFSALQLTSTKARACGKNNSDRGLWAVLADEFSVQAGHRVSMSEVRKKVQILKRLIKA